jgi:hypothetical protein
MCIILMNQIQLLSLFSNSKFCSILDIFYFNDCSIRNNYIYNVTVLFGSRPCKPPKIRKQFGSDATTTRIQPGAAIQYHDTVTNQSSTTLQQDDIVNENDDDDHDLFDKNYNNSNTSWRTHQARRSQPQSSSIIRNNILTNDKHQRKVKSKQSYEYNDRGMCKHIHMFHFCL